MKKTTGNARRGGDLSPRRQMYWDWRAAGNFIGGGTGGSLVFFAAFASLSGAAFGPLALAGLALVAAGLVCVWLEIGRPWRALNVFRHPSTSWMTREASVAPFLFVVGALALLVGGTALVWMAAALGVGFVYSQARILTADKGIPAWRHPRAMPLLVATGLTEGAGALAVLAPWLAPQAMVWLPLLLIVLLMGRWLAWRAYLAGLRSDGAPLASLRELEGLGPRLLGIGHVAPLLLVLIAVGAAGGALAALATLALAAGGLLAAAGGWLLKYTLVRRAAFNQGFALPHQPVRGRAPAAARQAPPAKPGWGGSCQANSYRPNV